MKYISQELSKKLYELTGLVDKASTMCWCKTSGDWKLINAPGYEPKTDELYPAYNFSFLFDQLPRYTDKGWDLYMHCAGEDAIEFYYQGSQPTMVDHSVETHDPTVGIALLLIDLYKQGTLRKKTHISEYSTNN